MALAASITPPSTSIRLLSTMRATYGNALMVSGKEMVMVPVMRPVTARVTFRSITSKMMKGMERRKLMMVPSTILNLGRGLMPPLRVTTSSTPRAMPMM